MGRIYLFEKIFWRTYNTELCAPFKFLFLPTSAWIQLYNLRCLVGKMDMVHLLGVRNKYMCYGFITTLLIWLLIGPNTNDLKHALLQYFQFSRYNFLQSDKILILKHSLPIHSLPEEILWSVFYSEILTFSTTNILIQTPCYLFMNHK